MSVRAGTSPIRRPGDYVCPRCRTAVTRQREVYACTGCGAKYPVLCGIPDFRLEPDRYLTLEEERAKAVRLHTFSQTHSFAETVGEYYRITDDVPPDMATRFADYVLAGEVRGRTVLDKLPWEGAERAGLLDAGCGSGGTVAAAARAGQTVIGIDIALRWLVIAQKRLAEEGLSGELVCADISNPPFVDGAFDRISAIDLLEHLPDSATSARSIEALLLPGGRLYGTAANRFTLASYPPAGLWGVGFLPTALRQRYVVWRRGFDTLRFLAMLSPAKLIRLLKAAGFADIHTAPMTVSSDRELSFGTSKRIVLFFYRQFCSVPLTRMALLQIGPVFEFTARRPKGAPFNKRTVP